MNLPILPAQPGCTNCDLHTGCKSVGLPSLWIENSLAPAPDVPAVVFVGQNPGYHEDVAGEIFVGKTGGLVRGASVNGKWYDGGYVDGISLRTRASVYLTNTVRCWTVADAKPSAKQIKACVPYLLSDLESIAALHRSVSVVLMGDVAVKGWFKVLFRTKGDKTSLKKAFKRNAHAYTLPSGRTVTLFSTFHPAYILRNINYAHAVDLHMSMLDRHLSGTITSVSTPHIILPRNPITCPAKPSKLTSSPPPSPSVAS